VSFARYPSYKPSGVEWLGDVPSHWHVRPLKHVARLSSGGTPDKTREDYWNGDVPWASSKDLKVAALADTEDHITQLALSEGAAQLVPAGRILVVVRGMILAHSFPVTTTLTPMAINQDLKAIEPVSDVDSAYLAWLLRGASSETSSRIDEAAHGTKVLRLDAWTSVQLPLPPSKEQRAIAAFLQDETAKTDALVTEQRRLMDLLKEKRQAVISHAVTKGLNPDAPMKPSGIEWLGDAPAHWRIISLGRVTSSRCDGPFGSGLKSEHYADAGVRVIRLQNITSNQFDGSNEVFVSIDYYARELTGHEVLGGDLLIAGLGDENNPVGRACIAPEGIEPAMVKADCFRFRLDTVQCVPAFVAALLCASAKPDGGVLSSGSTRSRIPLSVMASRRLALPPASEQAAIAEFVQTESQRFSTLTGEAVRAIALLQERRTALISAAVTGQIDVRDMSNGTSA